MNCCQCEPSSVCHTLLDSMPALYTHIRNEPGLTRDAQKLSPKQSSRRPTALPSKYTDQDSSQVPATQRPLFSTFTNGHRVNTVSDTADTQSTGHEKMPARGTRLWCDSRGMFSNRQATGLLLVESMTRQRLAPLLHTLKT